MPEGDNITDLMHSAAAARRMHLSDASRRVVQDCREIAARTLPSLLAGLFDKLDDALFDMADKSDRNALQTAYFDVMRDVRKSRSRIERRFVQDVIDGFDAFWGSGRSEASVSGSLTEADMALVDDRDLEETLAVNNMVSKGESLYRRELHALAERFSHLANGMSVDQRVNPLAPTRLCSAFREAVSILDIDIPVKLVVYKLFDKQVMRYVGAMYDELNACLAAAGVLPKLAPRARRNAVAPGVRERSGAPVVGTLDASRRSGARDAREGDVLATLRGLLDPEREPARSSGGQDQGGPAGGPPSVDPGQLIAALSSLQQRGVEALHHAGGPDAGGPLEIRDVLAREFRIGGDGSAERRLGSLEDDVIEVVTMLFELILEDPAIPDPLKVPIARLQIPVLKAALMDSSFFSDGAHPARRLLNNLAQASVGWTGEPDPGGDSLYGVIQSVVNRVLAEFNRDIEVFTRLDEEFAAFIESEHRGAQAAEERASQVVRGKERLALAKRQVSEEISCRLDEGGPTPAVVREILDEAWKDVMLLVYLRQGAESAEWKGALRVVDDLVWSARPKGTFEERQELLKLIPELLRRLRDGLRGISFDQHRMASLLKELQAVHIASLRPGSPGPGGADPDAGFRPGPPADADPDGARIPPRAVPPATVTDLEVGTWMELAAQDGAPVRAKLSWRSSVSDLCVLVDRRGGKVLDIGLGELAELMRAGRARIVSGTDVPLVDRALDALMQTLRGSRAGPSGAA